MRKMKRLLAVVVLFAAGVAFGAATVTEQVVEMPTYPFSDPDPVPAVAERRYPYFRYDGSTPDSETRAWKTVVLENENVRLDSEADLLFAACGDKPDESVFYMVRSARRTGKERLADLERAKSLGDSWRVGRALCQHYADVKDYAGMLAVAKDYVARYPKKNPIQISYADALVKNRLFKEAMEYLEGVTILPSEHRDNATGIWQECQKALGLQVTWPENLGKGEPYHD